MNGLMPVQYRENLQSRYDLGTGTDASGLEMFLEFYLRNPSPALHILDGTHVLRDDQLKGNAESLDMAAVSLNPLAIDYLVLERMGVPFTNIDYLERLFIEHDILGI